MGRRRPKINQGQGLEGVIRPSVHTIEGLMAAGMCENNQGNQTR